MVLIIISQLFYLTRKASRDSKSLAMKIICITHCVVWFFLIFKQSNLILSVQSKGLQQVEPNKFFQLVFNLSESFMPATQQEASHHCILNLRVFPSLQVTVNESGWPFYILQQCLSCSPPPILLSLSCAAFILSPTTSTSTLSTLITETTSDCKIYIHVVAVICPTAAASTHPPWSPWSKNQHLKCKKSARGLTKL